MAETETALAAAYRAAQAESKAAADAVNAAATFAVGCEQDYQRLAMPRAGETPASPAAKLAATRKHGSAVDALKAAKTALEAQNAITRAGFYAAQAETVHAPKLQAAAERRIELAARADILKTELQAIEREAADCLTEITSAVAAGAPFSGIVGHLDNGVGSLIAEQQRWNLIIR